VLSFIANLTLLLFTIAAARRKILWSIYFTINVSPDIPKLYLAKAVFLHSILFYAMQSSSQTKVCLCTELNCYRIEHFNTLPFYHRAKRFLHVSIFEILIKFCRFIWLEPVCYCLIPLQSPSCHQVHYCCSAWPKSILARKIS
jgi:hypothetical protein